MVVQKNGFKVSNDGFLVYFNGLRNEPMFNKQLNFELHLIKLECSDEWVEETIIRAIKLLKTDDLPSASKSCSTCSYLKDRWKVKQKLIELFFYSSSLLRLVCIELSKLVNLIQVDRNIALINDDDFLYSLIKVFFGIFIARQSFTAFVVTVLFVSSNIDCSPKTSSSLIKPTVVPFFEMISTSPFLKNKHNLTLHQNYKSPNQP